MLISHQWCRAAAAAAVVGMLVCTRATTTASELQNRSDDVERTIAAFLDPFANRDVPGFIDYFAEDATVFMPPSASGASPRRIQGKRAIATEFEQLYQRLNLEPKTQGRRIVPVDLMAQRIGDVAIVTFHLGTESARGRRTLILVHTSAGWRIAHLHASDFTRG